MAVKKVQRILNKPRRWRWTVKDYYRIADLGLFIDKRVELLEGEIFQMPPMKTPHAAALELTRFAVERVFGAGHWIRMQLPLHFGPRSEPEPDIAVVTGGPRDYTAHPTTALLIVEVSEATLSYDRRRKGSLYARVGIADYWIVRNRELRLGDLYRTDGRYSGWNWRAVVATVLGCFFAWIGLIIPTLRPLYDYAWFVGFGVAFFVHWGLMKALPPDIIEAAEVA